MPRRFDFISPGVQLTEVDLSQVPSTPPKDGLLLIGRARKGPAMKVIQCNNLEDFTDVFGLSIDGVRQDDAWRDGNTGAPNYAAYAAQAYLAAGVGPVKFIRLLGLQYADDATSRAGWTAGSTMSTHTEANKTAQGLFIFPSSSTSGLTDNEPRLSGTLAAVFYTPLGAGVGLVGKRTTNSYENSTDTVNGVTAQLVYSSGPQYQFDLSVTGGNGISNTTASINFNPYSDKYIRGRLNTDPTKVYANNQYNETDVSYFLGETFETELDQRIPDFAGEGDAIGVILSLGNSYWTLGDMTNPLKISKSGWFIGQWPQQKYLFRLVSLEGGEEFQNKYYARISSITPAKGSGNASFTIQIVRKGPGSSNKLVIGDNSNDVVESFDGVNLDPTSVNYIGKIIGDQNIEWSTSTQKFSISGLYPNRSDYVRVELASGLTGKDIPAGFIGPKRRLPELTLDGIIGLNNSASVGWLSGRSSSPMTFTTNKFISNWDGVTALECNMSASVRWPQFRLSGEQTKNGTNYNASDYFGLHHGLKSEKVWAADYNDIARERGNFSMEMSLNDAFSNAEFVFALEDIVSGSATTEFYHVSGSNQVARGAAAAPFSSVAKRYGLTGSGGIIESKGIMRFNVPFFGGFDGVDVQYADPFSNKRIENAALGYPRYTMEQAIEMVRDPDNLKYELISIPGMIHASTQDRLLGICEDRGDALAVIDVDGIYQPRYDVESAEQNASISTTVSTLENRALDTSYACTYFPNVFLSDTLNGNGSILKAPPSVAGIGAIAQSERVSQPWFAPAGFNRGGLGRLGGSKGPVVMGTVEHLTKNNRDTLYNAHSNPIARFPSTGDVVVFGQRTLQQDASALDRINVRRLMIYLKRQIGIIADTILFDQNVQATWNRFKFQAETILSAVQTELGITEYKLVLDNTTTTPDLVDRNILYAKIFVKPARAIEFIAVDFIITRSGVEF